MEVHSSTRCTLMLLKVTPPWFESYISCLTPAPDMRVTACPLFETYPHDQRGSVQRPLLVDDQFQSCRCDFLVGWWLALLYQMFAKYSGTWYELIYKVFFREMCRPRSLAAPWMLRSGAAPPHPLRASPARPGEAIYPLVSQHNYRKSLVWEGKSTTNGYFSIAMLNYPGVYSL